MSSPPSKSEPTRRKRPPFEPWRKVMIAGGLLLLAMSMLGALMDPDPPGWLSYAVNFVGYGFLAVGFVLALRSFREKEEAKKQKPEK